MLPCHLGIQTQGLKCIETIYGRMGPLESPYRITPQNLKGFCVCVRSIIVFALSLNLDRDNVPDYGMSSECPI